MFCTQPGNFGHHRDADRPGRLLGSVARRWFAARLVGFGLHSDSDRVVRVRDSIRAAADSDVLLLCRGRGDRLRSVVRTAMEQAVHCDGSDRRTPCRCGHDQCWTMRNSLDPYYESKEQAAL